MRATLASPGSRLSSPPAAASSPKAPLRLPPGISPPRIRTWTRTRVDVVGEHRVFAVEKSELLDPDGHPFARPMFTIRCSAWCNVIALTPARELVMIWQYRHGTDALSLEIPGGVLDAGEAPIDAAHRELREETGYAADELEPFLEVHPNPALQGNVCHTFFARNARLVGATRFDQGEECELALVPLVKLRELVDSGVVTHALVVCPLERMLRKMGEGWAI